MGFSRGLLEFILSLGIGGIVSLFFREGEEGGGGNLSP